jgi:aspartate/glutamate racemase
MPTVAAVYTSMNIIEPISALFRELLPEVRLINIADSSLIQDVIAAGGVTDAVTRRLVAYWQAAAETGADLIFNTCSSIGEVVALGQRFVDTPIVQIDHAMAEKAVRDGATIGVLATLPTTLGPTVRLVQRKAAEAGRVVTVHEGLAAGAYQLLASAGFHGPHAGDARRGHRPSGAHQPKAGGDGGRGSAQESKGLKV